MEEEAGGLQSGDGIGQGGGPAVGNAAGRGGAEGQRGGGKQDASAIATGKRHGTDEQENGFVSQSQLYTAEGWAREAAAEDKGDEDWRVASRRDYARVIHSPCFRRLQGKTQLFPGHESDFFRNRLTHSLEVAQIAESIAHRLNYTEAYFKTHPIDPRLCVTAALMHDLGHPPFGHNGEKALDDKMLRYGGFEGNAQTFRIVARLERKAFAEGANELTGFNEAEDRRLGLGLCYRSIASILKYDHVIPHVRDDGADLVKGYYADDADLVRRIKSAVCTNTVKEGEFKTVECAIMDIADDIAYSTYDLEDSLKAGFLTPAEILSSSDELLRRVAAKVARATKKTVSARDVLGIMWSVFDAVADEARSGGAEVEADTRTQDLFGAINVYRASKNLASNGYLRTDLTSALVNEFISGVYVSVDEGTPPELSKVRLSDEAHVKVETLKNYTYEATIFSPRLKVAEFRGYEVVSAIFEALSEPKGYLLMPDDVRALHRCVEANATARMRVVCDFVAGMTDRYAVEFYGRLHSEDAQSIFKPI